MFKALTRKMMRIARMEFRQTARNRAFVIVTIIGPFIIVAMSVLPSLLAMNEADALEETTISMINGPPELQQAVTSALSGTPIRIVDAGRDEEALRRALQNKSIRGYLVLPDTLDADRARLVTSGAASFALVGTLQSVIGQSVVSLRMARAGLDPAQVAELSRRPTLDVSRYDASAGVEAGQDPTTAIFTVLAFTMMLYMTILLYGQAIGRSVLNEKLSKTVEIMLSSVNPRELLVGKIAGKAAASILQYAIWILMAAGFLNIIGPLVDLQFTLAGGTSTYLYLVMFFLLAFLLYSSVYAALGAASEDETHLGQLAWPVILFLVIPMVSIGAIATSPDSVFPRVLSLIPLTSPIVMFQRLLVGNPAAWEVALCLGLLLMSICVVALLAAKIFRVGILMTGKRFSMREIVRWVRYRV